MRLKLPRVLKSKLFQINMNDIIEKVENFIKKYKINGEVIIGFSGGADSMCLLDVMQKLAPKYNIRLTAVHLNHNWRGEQSLQDEQNCKDFCHNRGINFYSETLPDNIPHTETAARDARYNFFENCANKFNSGFVLTAHNASDNAETVLYRIFKGTGTNGLVGIKKHRESYYRPLLAVFREDIENYCKKNNLTPNIDSSNFDIKYNRNFIRHEILDMAAKKINPDVLTALNRLSELAAETEEIADEYINLIRNDIKKAEGIDAKRFAKLSKALQNRLIYEMFQDYSLDVDNGKINRVREFINEASALKSPAKYSLNDIFTLYAGSNFISVQKNSDKIDFSISVKDTGIYQTPFGEFIIEACKSIPQNIKKTDESYAYAELNDIDFTLRTRLDGDVIQPLGMKGHQKLKKYLNEKKLASYEKDRLVVLARGKEIYWAAGCGLSEKIRAGEKPTHVLKFIKREVGNGN